MRAVDVVERSANGLLSELAVHERNAIQRASQLQFCAAGDVLLQANSRTAHVFFPVSAVVAVVRRLRDGRAAGVGLFGSEGMAGIDAALEINDQMDVVVQSAGSLYCMASDDLLHQFQGTGRLRTTILRFTHTLLAQVGQNVVCNRYHSLRQRLARWLLMIDDRAGCVDGPQARRLLAMALGASEEEIEEALAALAPGSGSGDRRKAIAIDRDALEAGCCECYDVIETPALRQPRGRESGREKP